MELEIAGSSDTGVRRDHNEDVIWWRNAAPEDERREAIMIVADGMGGAAAGEVASRAAVERSTQVLTEGAEPRLDVRLRHAIEAATAYVNQLAEGNPKYDGMGTTMSVAVVVDDHLVVGHVGDSRCYLIRGGRAQQVTMDHTWVADEVRHGRLTPEEARRHPNRHVISRSVGVSPTVEVDVYPPLPLENGDVVLLCSDGLSDVVRDEEVAEYASRFPPEQVASRLIELANSRGGPDNISVVVGRIGTPTAYVAEEETARVETHALLRPRGGAGTKGGLAKVGGAVLFVGVGITGAWILLGGSGSGSTTDVTASPTAASATPSETPPSPTTQSGTPTTRTETPDATNTGGIVGETDCSGQDARRFETYPLVTFLELADRYEIPIEQIRACNPGVEDDGIPYPGELIIPCFEGRCPVDPPDNGQRPSPPATSPPTQSSLPSHSPAATPTPTGGGI